MQLYETNEKFINTEDRVGEWGWRWIYTYTSHFDHLIFLFWFDVNMIVWAYEHMIRHKGGKGNQMRATNFGQQEREKRNVTWKPTQQHIYSHSHRHRRDEEQHKFFFFCLVCCYRKNKIRIIKFMLLFMHYAFYFIFYYDFNFTVSKWIHVFN